MAFRITCGGLIGIPKCFARRGISFIEYAPLDGFVAGGLLSKIIHLLYINKINFHK